MARKKGRGGLYLKKTARGMIYYARITMPDGSKSCKCLDTDDYNKAIRMLDDMTSPMNGQDYIENLDNLKTKYENALRRLETGVKCLPGIYLKDAYDMFLKSRYAMKLTKGTLGGYLTAINCLIDFLKVDHKYIDEMRSVTREMADEFVRYYYPKLASGTLNNHISKLRKVWAALFEEGHCNVNPWSDINTVEDNLPVTGRRRALTEDEIKRLMDNTKDENIKLGIMLGRYCGMRISDACCLEWDGVWSWVDLNKGLIGYNPIKTRKKNKDMIILPIHPALMEYLVKFDDGIRHGFVSRSNVYRYKSHYMPQIYQRLFDRSGVELNKVDERGIKRSVTGFHALRHSFIERMVESGKMDPILLSKIVGHTSISTTSIYFHSNIDRIRAAMGI